MPSGVRPSSGAAVLARAIALAPSQTLLGCKATATQIGRTPSEPPPFRASIHRQTVADSLAAQVMTDVIKLSSPATREFWKIPVLFEDEHLLALDKPSLLLVSPDRYNISRPNLMKLLHRDIERGAPWAIQRRITYLANTHRLDFETSGVLLLAKDKPALTALANQFGAEMQTKIYIALAHGGRPADKFQVDAKLAPHPVKAGIMRIDEKHGKRSRTDFEVIERFRGYILLKCQPLTARTHQIRVHLQSQGLPIVGDAVYGGSPLLLSSLKPDYRFKVKQEERPLIGQVALHSEQLKVTHPVGGTSFEIIAPWPKDLKVAVKYLRNIQHPASTVRAGKLTRSRDEFGRGSG